MVDLSTTPSSSHTQHVPLATDLSFSPTPSRLSLQESSEDAALKRIASLEKALRYTRKQNKQLESQLKHSSHTVNLIAELEDKVASLEIERQSLLSEVQTLKRIQRRHEKVLVDHQQNQGSAEAKWLKERKVFKDQLAKYQQQLDQLKSQLETANAALRHHTQSKTPNQSRVDHVSQFKTPNQTPNQSRADHLSPSPLLPSSSSLEVRLQHEASRAKRYKTELRNVKMTCDELAQRNQQLEAELVLKSRQSKLEKVQQKSRDRNIIELLSTSPLQSKNQSKNQSFSFDSLSFLHWSIRCLLRMSVTQNVTINRKAIEVKKEVNPSFLIGHAFLNGKVVFTKNRHLVTCSDSLIKVFDPFDTCKLPKFYHAHGSIVSCIALHQDGITIASGQLSQSNTSSNTSSVQKCQEKSRESVLSIWNSENLNTLTTMKVPHSGGIRSCVFTKSRSKMVTLGQDDGQLFLIDYESHQLLSKITLPTPTKALFITSSELNLILTFGLKHVSFWSTEIGNSLIQYPAKYKDTFTCVTNIVSFSNGTVIASSSEGNLFELKPGDKGKSKLKCKFKSVSGHKGNIMSMIVIRKGQNELLVTSSNDCSIKFWTFDLNYVGCVILPNQSYITCLIDSHDVDTFLACLSDGSIKSIRLPNHLLISDPTIPQFKILNSSHGLPLDESEDHPSITGLEKSCISDLFITSATDGTVKCWNCKGQLQMELNLNCYLESISAFNSFIIASSNTQLVLLKHSDTEISVCRWFSFADVTGSILMTKFDPTGSFIAALTSNFHLVIFLFENEQIVFEKSLKLNVEGLFKSLDWSSDSQYIRVAEYCNPTGNYSIINTSSMTCHQSISSEVSINIDWFTQTLPSASPTAVTLSSECNVSHCCALNEILVFGDESGYISIINSSHDDGKRDGIKCHSRVTSLLLMKNDEESHLVSTGAEGCICITKII
ncbi:hypothetical protein P9112_000328 [Eukaryota sp. TZLM1-RC]